MTHHPALHAVAAALTAAWLGCADVLPPAAPGEAPHALARAHDAWLRGDLTTTSAEAVAALAAPGASRAATDNAAALLERAWEAGDGALPAPWTLPAGVTSVRVSVIRKEEPDRVTHRLVVQGTLAAPDALDDLWVRSPEGMLLHRAAGLGAWTVEPEDGAWAFELESDEWDAPPPEGAYTVRFVPRGGAAVAEGVFPLTAQRASRSPRAQVLSGEALGTPGDVPATVGTAPVLAWEDFRTPEHRAWEARAVSALVMRRAESGWRTVWSTWVGAPARGNAPTSAQAQGLEPGRHWLIVTWTESRRYGPLTLARAARTAVPFEVER